MEGLILRRFINLMKLPTLCSAIHFKLIINIFNFGA